MIAVNARFLTQAITGTQRFAIEIVSAMLEAGEDLLLLTPPGELPNVPHIMKSRIRQFGFKNGHVWEQFSLPKYLRKIGSPRLLNLMSTAPIFYRRQVVTHHDITYIRHPESFAQSFRLVYSVIVPRILRSAQHVITVSNFSKSELIAHYGIQEEKVSVVYNAASNIFTNDQVISDPTLPRYLLGVSSPNYHKNFQRLELAFRRYISSNGSDLNLYIVGGQARSFSQQSGTDSDDGRIRYLGRVDDSELAELYRGAQGFAFPSLYEGFGIPPLEAQRSGCPVISSYAASMPEILGESALYFDPLDVADIARAIKEIDINGTLRHELIEKGVANSAAYSWFQSARTVSEIVHRIV